MSLSTPFSFALFLLFSFIVFTTALPSDIRDTTPLHEARLKRSLSIDISVDRCGDRNRLEAVCNLFCVKDGVQQRCVNTELTGDDEEDPYVPPYYYQGKRTPSTAMHAIGVLLGESFFDLPRKWKCDC